MKRKIFKLLAAVLASAAVLAYAVAVFAVTQSPVDNRQRIRGMTNARTYDILLTWNRPPAPRQETLDTTNIIYTPSDGGAGYYSIYYSESTSTNYQIFDNSLAHDTASAPADGYTQDALSLQRNDVALNSGRMYAFRIEPYHIEIQPRPNNPPPLISYITPTPSTIKDMLFMTDIRVSGEGSGNKITVSWDNIMFDNREVFSAWHVYYKLNDNDPSFSSQYHPILVTGDQLIRQGDKLTYTIVDDRITPSDDWLVKIEPVYLIDNGVGRELRRDARPTADAAVQMTIANKTYDDISYSPRGTGGKDYYDIINIKIPLDVVETNDPNSIMLVWYGLGNMSNVSKIIIQSSKNQTNWIQIGEIGGIINVQQLQNWITQNPREKMYYRLLIERTGGFDNTYSEIAVYDPDFTDFQPNSPTVREFSHDETPLSLYVVWDAFIREAYTDIEAANVLLTGIYAGKYLDRNVRYDIYIADDLAVLESLNEDHAITVRGYDSNVTEYPGAGGGMYSLSGITEYYSGVPSDIVKRTSIDENVIYYVKIVARRVSDDGSLSEPSKPAYSSHFIPSKNVFTHPNSLGKPPLRIKTDDDGNFVITQSTITVQWETRYYEVYNPADNSWYSRIGVDPDGTLCFGSAVAPAYKQYELTSLGGFDTTLGTGGISDVSSFLASNLPGFDPVANAIRYINISDPLDPLADALFEMHAAPASVLDDISSYEAYLESIRDNLNAWTRPVGQPSPSGENGVLEYTIAGLNPETSYLIIIRPYIVLPSGIVLRAHNPSDIIASTQAIRGDLDIIPTVPELIEVEEGATFLVVKWAYDPNLMYEFKYSELFSDYPNAGITITNDIIMQNGYFDVEDGVEYVFYTIEKLFPQTEYYLWIRSYVTGTSGELRMSGWSNVLSMRTKEIDPPKPPQGLGLVTNSHLEIINKELALMYRQTDSNYLIIEWLRDPNDTEAISLMEMSGIHEVLTGTGISNTKIVKFNELLPNRSYYIRAKTRLTITKTTAGNLFEYQYIVQISPTDEFIDYIEVVTPSTIAGGQGLYIMKESAWGQTIRLYTEPWYGEYDTSEDPNKYLLPDQDYEIIYDSVTNTLTFRFRSNKKDAQGNSDHNVDQRFISGLISSGVHDYTLDMTSYNGRTPSARVLEMPYSIIRAFEERKINLIMVCGDTVFTLPWGFAGLNSVTGLGYGSSVRITAVEHADDSPALKPLTELFAADPHKLSVSLVSGQNVQNLRVTSKNISVTQKIGDITLYSGKNIASYIYSSSSAEWARSESSINNRTGAFSISTSILGNYSVIARSAVVPAGLDSASRTSFSGINEFMTVSGLESLSGSSPVTPEQFNKLIAAVALSAPSVSLDVPLTEAERNSLYKSGMLASGDSGGNVSRQSAMNSLVLLYENMTKSLIRGYTSLQDTPYADIALADSAYLTGLLKAADLGFLGDSQSARPRDPITLTEFLEVLVRILQR